MFHVQKLSRIKQRIGQKICPLKLLHQGDVDLTKNIWNTNLV